MLFYQTFRTKAVCLNLCVEQLVIDTLRPKDLGLAWRGVCLAGPVVEGMKWITHCNFSVSSYHSLCSGLGTTVPLPQLNPAHV